MWLTVLSSFSDLLKTAAIGGTGKTRTPTFMKAVAEKLLKGCDP